MESRSLYDKLYNLSDKTAIITGGAMGIGYSIAKRLAEAGASVIIADINVEKGEDAVDYLNKQLEAYCYTLARGAIDIARHAKRKTIKDTDIMP